MDSDSELEFDEMRRARAVSAALVLGGRMPVVPLVAMSMSAALLERPRLRGCRFTSWPLFLDCARRVRAAEAELALGVCAVETGFDAVE